MNSFKIEVEKEISRILGKLGLAKTGNGLKEPILEKILAIHLSIHKESSYYKAGKLVPIIIYLELRLRNQAFDKNLLIKISNISHVELINFIAQLKRFINKNCRDRIA